MDNYIVEVYRTAFDEISKVIKNDRKPAYMILREIKRVIRILKEYDSELSKSGKKC